MAHSRLAGLASAALVVLYLASAPAAQERRPQAGPPEDAASEPEAAPARRTERAFREAWALFFGAEPQAPPAPAHATAEAAFRALWESAATALDSEERDGARAALRLAALGDAAEVDAAVRRTVAAGRLLPGEGEAVLWYVFLLEEALDPAALPEALPPGHGAARLRAAVETRGGDWDAFLNRAALWTLSRAVAAGLLDETRAGLPAVWVQDRDLLPGAFAAWRLQAPEWAASVRGESVADASAGRLRLLTLFADGPGPPVASGTGAATGRPLLLPRRGGDLWLVLWNPPGGEPAGAGLTLTLWADLTPPFQVLEARLFQGSCDLLLTEMAGVAAYRLSARGSASEPDALGTDFPSEGPGLHRYHVVLPGSGAPRGRLELRGLTWAGGTAAAPIPPPGRRPSP